MAEWCTYYICTAF